MSSSDKPVTKQREILTREDIRLLVDSFYEKVRDNAHLAPIFNSVIGDRWPEHLEKMVRFWETVLLDERTYFGSPFPPHALLPITRESFQTWMKLFSETIVEKFTGEKAEEALWRAGKMAEMFMLKLSRYDSDPGQFIQ